ncbi:AAA family ATPase, partial [uncultured Psychrobacillus sp.]|uniref:AAA family ATPase n=1 Tax=uncultured Psychrobacillus sp. TaxID=1551585 RepID=UPI00261CE45F
VRRKPYSVVLFDEIEKAHPDVFNMLLQVLEDGHMTDAKGRRVSFKNTVLIMTSNAGVQNHDIHRKLGFKTGNESDQGSNEEIKNEILSEIKHVFRPEFLNRIDETIVFHALEKDHLKQIVTLMSNQLTTRLKEQEIYLELTDAAREKIATEGFDPEYGARPIRRALQKHVEDYLSEELLKGNVKKGQTVVMDVVNNEFAIRQGEPVNVSE